MSSLLYDATFSCIIFCLLSINALINGIVVLYSSSSSLKYFCLDFEGYKDGSGKQLLKFLLKIVNGKSDFQSNYRGIGHLAEDDASFQALVPFVEKVENKDEITWEFGYTPEKWRKKKDAKASA